MARSRTKALRLGLLSLFLATGTASALQFTDGATQLTIDAAKYQVVFDKATGSIAWITDKATNGKVVYGDRAGMLWYSRAGGVPAEFVQSSKCPMTYAWAAAGNTLTFHYTGALTVDVKVTVSDAEWMALSAAATNTRAAVIDTFSFPSDLLLNYSEVKEAFYPRDPGITLSKAFFTGRKSFFETYPGHIYADFIAVKTNNGSLALYSTGKDVNLETSMVGYKDLGTGDYTTMVHKYSCTVAPGQTRNFPPVAIRVGESYIASGIAYRADNGIDKFPSLAEKLGAKKDRFFSEVVYKWDMPATDMSFAESKAGIIDKLPLPGILLPVTFQNGKHDQMYPDFLPPNPVFGTTDQMKDMVSYAHSKGSLVYPYVNFSWWDVKSPTLLSLPAGVTAANISTRTETYNGNTGVVVIPDNAFVLQRTTQERDALCTKVGLDGLLEDQWGVHPMLTTANFNGVQTNLAAGKTYNLGTECGIDVQAKYLATFLGSMYDWDVRWPDVTTAYSFYFPMEGVMLRDKVLLYQHGLSQIGWTHSKAVLRWNLAYGYQLSSSVFLYADSPTSPAPEDFKKDGLHIDDNPWIKVAGEFQKFVLSQYADETVTNFETVGTGVYKTSFKSFASYSCWNGGSYAVNGHTIAADGAATIANNGTAVAGVFTKFNNVALSAGDHYIAMVQDATSMKVFHPKGAATPLTLALPPEWKTYTLKSYSLADAPLGDVAFTKNGQTITFTAAENLNGGPGGYYRLVSEQATGINPLKSALGAGAGPKRVTVYDASGKTMGAYQETKAGAIVRKLQAGTGRPSRAPAGAQALAQ